ncbi:MAG: hypothetical protein ACRC6A_09280 [Fusobacteriaceae bacterium]
MSFTREQLLTGYKKRCELLNSIKDTKVITEDKVISFGKHEFDLKKGWIMPNCSDEDLAKIMHMENLVFKRYAEKTDITFDDIDKITKEVFGEAKMY